MVPPVVGHSETHPLGSKVAISRTCLQGFRRVSGLRGLRRLAQGSKWPQYRRVRARSIAGRLAGDLGRARCAGLPRLARPWCSSQGSQHCRSAWPPRLPPRELSRGHRAGRLRLARRRRARRPAASHIGRCPPGSLPIQTVLKTLRPQARLYPSQVQTPISTHATTPSSQLLPADSNRAESRVPKPRPRPDRPHNLRFPLLSLQG